MPVFWGNFRDSQVERIRSYIAGVCDYISGNTGISDDTVPTIRQYGVFSAVRLPHFRVFEDPPRATTLRKCHDKVAEGQGQGLPGFAPNRIFVVMTREIRRIASETSSGNYPDDWWGIHTRLAEGGQLAVCPLIFQFDVPLLPSVVDWPMTQSVISHELLESMLNGAWVDDGNNEPGDSCEDDNETLGFGVVQGIDDNVMAQCAVFSDHVPAAAPALIQSSWGNKGNFELFTPWFKGGFAHWIRNNDDNDFPWTGPRLFSTQLRIAGLSVIQSSYGNGKHFEMVANAGGQLAHFWRGLDSTWSGPTFFAPSDDVQGSPALVQAGSASGPRFDAAADRFTLSFGDFHVVVPQPPADGAGLLHYTRSNADGSQAWNQIGMFAGANEWQSVCLVWTGIRGAELEAFAISDGKLAQLRRVHGNWTRPLFIAENVSGTPSAVVHGYSPPLSHGERIPAIELVVPRNSGGLLHFSRRAVVGMPWTEPTLFAAGDSTPFEAVALISSNLAPWRPLEAVARRGYQLSHFWQFPVGDAWTQSRVI